MNYPKLPLPNCRAKQKVHGRGASLRQTKRQRQPLELKWLKGFGVVTVLAALVSGAAYGVARIIDTPVSRVTVNGEFRQVDKQLIERLVSPFLQDGFVALDMVAMRETLVAQPWIFDANIVRQWPSEITIEVVEQTVIARWGDKGYLNYRGELFLPDQTRTDRIDQTAMPLLDGPTGSSELVMSHYQQLNDALAPYGLVLNELNLTNRGGWVGKLTSGVDIQLGSDDVMGKLQRFLSVYRGALEARFADMKSADLRYNNGFAVEWRQGVQPGTDKLVANENR